MDTLLDSVSALGKRLTASGKTVYALVGIFILGTVLAVAGSLVKMQWLVVILGSIAGVLWFMVGYLVFNEILPNDLRDKVDFRGNFALNKRRWIVGWVLVVWLLLLEFAGHSLPKAIIGALNVAVLLGLWHLATATEFERKLASEADAVARLWEENRVDDSEIESDSPEQVLLEE